MDSVSNRRAMLLQSGGGFATLALAAMLEGQAHGNPSAAAQSSSRIEHHVPKVKRIVQLFMTGGASPMDLFDYKPELERLHGQMLGPKEKPEGFTAPAGALM